MLELSFSSAFLLFGGELFLVKGLTAFIHKKRTLNRSSLFLKFSHLVKLFRKYPYPLAQNILGFYTILFGIRR